MEAFRAGIEALINGGATPLTLLIKGAECNKDFANKQALEYQVWLSQAKLRGHSGIYSTLKAPKSWPFEGVTDLCNMPRRWELEGRLPDQVRATLVVLLPKKEDIERPISLTSVLYRTWCRLRWDKLRHWQCNIGQRLPWERSVPGTQVLQVALMRLLKCEVGRAVGRHVISLLVGLQCFYDSVELGQLLNLWEPLDFLPAFMNFIYEVYTGPRLLQVDVWVDDMSIDFVGGNAAQVSREALEGFKQGLEAEAFCGQDWIPCLFQ